VTWQGEERRDAHRRAGDRIIEGAASIAQARDRMRRRLLGVVAVAVVLLMVAGLSYLDLVASRQTRATVAQLEGVVTDVETAISEHNTAQNQARARVITELADEVKRLRQLVRQLQRRLREAGIPVPKGGTGGGAGGGSAQGPRRRPQQPRGPQEPPPPPPPDCVVAGVPQTCGILRGVV
jgi:hypothetical protein